MKNNVNISFVKVLWLAGFIALGISTISAVQLKKDVQLKGVHVDVIEFDGGDYFLTRDDVIAEVLELTGELEGQVLRNIDVRTIEEALHYNPFIEHADVYVSSNAMLSVMVKQRQPILRVFDNAGESYYVDKEGVKIPVSPHFTARVIVATGAIKATNIANVSESAQLTELHKLVSTINQKDFTKSLIEQIHVDGDGSVIVIPKVGEVKITFGKIERIEEKLENLTAFYEKVMNNGNWERYQSLDLSYKGQVIGKKRSTP